MAKGIKTGGRKKGSLNKDSHIAIEIAKKHGVCPIEFMCWVVKGDFKSLGYKERFEIKIGKDGSEVYQEVITVDHRIKAAKDLAEYLHPKLKSIEHKVSEETIENIERCTLIKSL